MIYAVSNHKGGVGKTTSAINIGAALATRKKRVLLIDLDPQANLTQSLGIKDSQLTIYDNLKGEKLISPIEYKNNLYVLPSSLDLSAAEIELSSEPGREYILKEFLSKLYKNSPLFNVSLLGTILHTPLDRDCPCDNFSPLYS